MTDDSTKHLHCWVQCRELLATMCAQGRLALDALPLPLLVRYPTMTNTATSLVSQRSSQGGWLVDGVDVNRCIRLDGEEA
jgi:hypothetical protein